MSRLPYKNSIRNLHALALADDFADVNAFCKGTGSPLVWVADHGTPLVVKALLARGADVKARDKAGRTALHYAAWNGNTARKNVRLLLAAGADVDAKDVNGKTPLMLAQGTLTLRMLRNRRHRMTLRDEVEASLKPLSGERLSDMWRVAGMQIFEIGVQRPSHNHKGDEVTRADWSLHVHCCWSIAGPEGEIVSSDDFGLDQSRSDENAGPFYDMLGDLAFTISKIRADDYGGIKLTMSGGYSLEIKACCSEDENPDEEQWRLLPKDKDERHFVIERGGVQRY